MAVQIRNCIFDAESSDRRNELDNLLTGKTVIAVVKKSPIEKSSNPRYIYEISLSDSMVHLEVGASKDVTALDTLLETFVISIITSDNGWQIGTDTDLRVG